MTTQVATQAVYAALATERLNVSSQSAYAALMTRQISVASQGVYAAMFEDVASAPTRRKPFIP